ncbi:MAG: ATP-binding cassette domain-containing protein [Clostridia bacterium]|nr:ATP-binding cassette domain-containing protein [Clostridia bacterium]
MVEIKNLTKKYGDNIVLNNINLNISEGEFIVILGPSGCGKTTLLKIINNLIDFDTGEVFIKGKSIKEIDPIELRRNIGYVIQQIGLFPHLKISQNISYVLDLQKITEEKQIERAEELITLVGLDSSFLNRYPGELSGGQKQRIGVARAIAADPEIILMDEPFGAVDEIVRKSLQEELKQLQKRLKKTIVFVTHDIDEAIKLGDRIIIMNQGQIEQGGSAEDFLFHPANDFIKEFLGLKNFTSYLSQVNISHVLSECVNNNEIYIYDDLTVLEGIKALFDLKILEVCVKNREEKVVGSFRFDKVKEKILLK